MGHRVVQPVVTTSMIAAALVGCVLLISACGLAKPSGDKADAVEDPARSTTTVGTTSSTVASDEPPGRPTVDHVPAPGDDPNAEQPSTTDVPLDLHTTRGPFRTGDAFHARCTVAWPPGPTRSSRGIEFRTTCQGIDDHYEFVLVDSTDQNLALSPSRATVVVDGDVVNSGTSAGGTGGLVVRARMVTVQ